MSLPVLPMGTLMTVAMLLAAAGVAALGAASRHGAGRVLAALIGAVAIAAALWQLAWYFPRHAATGWGVAAAASGLCLATAGASLISRRTAARLTAVRWPLVAALGALVALYGITIARL